MNENFSEKVNELRQNSNALGGYLINAAKNNPDAFKHKEIYEQFLSSDDWYLKKAAIFALLSVFKLDDKKYIDKAISFLADPNEDEEVRRWCLSGLSTVYRQKKIRDAEQGDFNIAANIREFNPEIEEVKRIFSRSEL